MRNGVHVDPAKEASAQDVHLGNHTSTLAIEYARQGLDWEDALRQRAKEVALMKELGLTTATAATQQTPTEDESKPDDEEADDRAA